MATLVGQALTLAQSVEKQLHTKLADRNTPNAEIAALLQEYRVSCEKIIFTNFKFASEHDIEKLLWKAHIEVSNFYRKQLGNIRRDSRNRAVEIRVLNKQYLEFIKASQRFYRKYILDLDTAFDGIPELRQVAEGWKRDGSTGIRNSNLSTSTKQQILDSCYQTLIQLGDLSRYRETELGGLGKKERNWGPAIGYYGLAAEINPENGAAYNQQAVLALADHSHFRATYYLYRALAVRRPFLLAKGNLDIEFKKIVTKWEKGELINKRSPREGSSAGPALVAWFLRLHGKCYRGKEYPEHEELENEVLSQLAVELKERSLDSTLHKIILINLAAEYYAYEQLQIVTDGNHHPEMLQAYAYFLRLNVKTIFTLLQLLQPELERITGDEDRDDVTARNKRREERLSDKVTGVARRILPGLRLYSSWFIKSWKIIPVAGVVGSLSQVDIHELWKAYSSTLTMLASVFPADRLPIERYLLEEDVDTVGFMPLLGEKTKDIWYTPEGKLKPKFSDPTIGRHHPNVEMLMRIRDFLVHGLLLTQDNEAPLVLDGIRFIYQEPNLPSELLASPRHEPNSPEMPTVELEDIPDKPEHDKATDDQQSRDIPPSESVSVSLSKDPVMNRMVDDLVGPEDGLDALQEEDENIPPTPPEQTFEDTALVNDSTYGIAPLTAEDFVRIVRNYPTCAPESPLLPNHNLTSSPSMRRFPSIPSLPDQSNIWKIDNGSSGSSSPFLSPGLHNRGSPLQAHSNSHSRGLSASSNRSSAAYPDAWAWSYYNPTLTGVLNNDPGGAYPYQGASALNLAISNRASLNLAQDVATTSPLLFGAGGGVWSADFTRSQNSSGRSPSNGQGG